MTIDGVAAGFANSSGPELSGIRKECPVYGNPDFMDQTDQTFGTYRPNTRAHTIEEHRKLWSVRSTGPIAEWQNAFNELSQDVAALADAFAERMAICFADGIDPAEAEITATLEIGAEAIRRFGLADRLPDRESPPSARQWAANSHSDRVSRPTLTSEAPHAVD